MKTRLGIDERYPHVSLWVAEEDDVNAWDVPEALFQAWYDAQIALEDAETAITYAALDAGVIDKKHPLTAEYYVCPHGRSVYGHCHQHKHLPVVGEDS